MLMQSPVSPLIEILREVPRRYRLPATLSAWAQGQDATASDVLALAIDQANTGLAHGQVPDASIQGRFLHALADLIRESMRPQDGDPALQAMVLRHQSAAVREYASLSAHVEQDQRQVRSTVNAIAHPAKQARLGADDPRQRLTQLHDAVASESWAALSILVWHMLREPALVDDAAVGRALARLRDDPAIARLQRRDALAQDAEVSAYQALWNRQGPRAGTQEAVEQGGLAQQRGAAVEIVTAQALAALVQRLDAAEAGVATYRLVTSMLVPAMLVDGAERAKTEWDAVLLRRPIDRHADAGWDVCLLVEVKASVDAVTTDFPRLLRGLQLFGQADDTRDYPFATHDGIVQITGASLKALAADDEVESRVLYCSNASVKALARPLSTASRMQLLSTPASLAFASAVVAGESADAQELAPVWQELLTSPRWEPVLGQYNTLRRVRNMMVHVDDLAETIRQQ